MPNSSRTFTEPANDPQFVDALHQVVAYNWADEERDYHQPDSEEGQSAHIFHHLVTRKEWLDDADQRQEATAGDSERPTVRKKAAAAINQIRDHRHRIGLSIRELIEDPTTDRHERYESHGILIAGHSVARGDADKIEALPLDLGPPTNHVSQSITVPRADTNDTTT